MTIGTESSSTSEHEFDLDITIFETDSGLAETDPHHRRRLRQHLPERLQHHLPVGPFPGGQNAAPGRRDR